MTVAFRLCELPALIVAVGAVVNAIEIGAFTRNVVLADCAGSFVDVAVSVTVPPVGIAAGALYIATTPLAV